MGKQKGRVQVARSKIAMAQAEGQNKRITANICDWGEPCCWACGYYKEGEKYVYKDTDKSVYKCWDRADFLERAHIIPFSISKDNSPENFVLLCKECHRKNPNLASYETYQVWLNSVESWTDRQFREMREAFTAYDISKEQIDMVLTEEGFFTSYFKTFLENSVVMVEGRLNPLTAAAAISDYSLQLNKLKDFMLVNLGEIEMKVYRYIFIKSSTGSTCDEAEIALSMSHQSCSAAFRRLVLKKAIYDSGVKKPTRTGRKARVYQVKQYDSLTA